MEGTRRSAVRLGEGLKVIFSCLLGILGFVLGALPAAAEEAETFALPDARSAFKVLRLEGNGVRWTRRQPDGSLLITYRVVSEQQEFPGARNCRKMTNPAAMLAATRVSDAVFRGELTAAFAMWEAAADLRFAEAADGMPADILIGAQVEPEGWAFADVFYDTASPERIKPISRALVCLNPTRRWKVGFDGDLGTYDLRYTLAHEIGHAIGLDHPNASGQIMGYRYDERFRTLQPGDLEGVLALYGERPLPNAGTTAAASNGKERHRASRHVSKRWGTRAFNARSH